MLQTIRCDHRAIDLAKAKRILKWQRDPEGMRIRILEAAKQEFAAHGLAGARVDRIAAKAGANKRMLYYHVGNKEDLYLEVLEGAYEKIRAEERGLDLEHLDPPEGDRAADRLHLELFSAQSGISRAAQHREPRKARHLKRSTRVKSMHSPFVEMIRTVVTRGVESGDFRDAVDPVQLYISIAGLCFFYLSNSATLERDLRPRPPEKGGEGRAPRAHGRAGAGGADREVDRGFRQGRGGGIAGCRRISGFECSVVPTNCAAATKAVIPGACGVSSTPRLLGSVTGVSGILGRPVCAGDDRLDMRSRFPRRDCARGLQVNLRPRK